MQSRSARSVRFEGSSFSGVRPALALFIGGLTLGSAAPACTDPVHDVDVKALGGEEPGVPPGEYHRVGQPCVTCHQPAGPAKTVFTIAGTVFGVADNQSKDVAGAGDVEILLVDSAGNHPIFPVKTNCVGNFWVTADNFDPKFPVRVRVRKNGQDTPMQTAIRREGSCAACHTLIQSFNSPGEVNTSVQVGEDEECPVSNVIRRPKE